MEKFAGFSVRFNFFVVVFNVLVTMYIVFYNIVFLLLFTSV